MPLNEPGWWYGRGADRSWQALALSPLSAFYDWVTRRRMARDDGLRSPLPVICVGNFTAGGTGKTPFVCWLAEALKQRAQTPVILTRGFGGRLAGPVWVDGDQHTAQDVGDEPLLIAKHAPVMVARDRAKGLRAILKDQDKFNVVIMDDGLQNPSVEKDLAIAVVDGQRGFGNGWVIPSGPLRASLSAQVSAVGAVVINRGSQQNSIADLTDSLVTTLRADGFEGPVLSATLIVPNDVPALENERVLAYAGIGNPERFFDTVRFLGATIVARHVFADHHQVTAGEAQALLQRAKDEALTLVTTEKDDVRLSDADASVAALKAASRVVPIDMVLSEQDQHTIDSLLEACLVNGT